MSLARWLIAVFVVSLLALALAVGGVYLLSWRQAQAVRAAQGTAYARAVAAQVGARAGGVLALVDSLAGDPRWDETLVRQPWAEAEARLQRMIPAALWVRLLPADGDAGPGVLGFADLDLAQRALEGDPPLAMHGIGTPGRHLAVARAIRRDGRVLAVLLVALDPKWLSQGLIPSPPGAYAIQQGKATLAFRGADALRGGPPTASLPIRGTLWQLRYWAPPARPPDPRLVAAAFVLALLSIAAVLYGCRFWLRRALAQDSATLFTLVNDQLAGTPRGNYALRLRELQPMMDRLLALGMPTPASPEAVPPAAVVEPGRVTVEEAVPEADVGAAEAPEPVANAVARIDVPERIFQPCDIRAPVAALSPALLQRLGLAIGTEIQARGEQTVVVGRDRRGDSGALAAALIEGLRASGRDVVDLGGVPAPLVWFGCHYLNVRSGIVVTGGSCPPEYGGLKLAVAGEFWGGRHWRRLRERLDGGEFASGMGQLESRDLLADYIGAVMDDVQVGRPLKVVIDHGAGGVGEVATALLRTLGCEVEEMRTESLWDPLRPGALEPLAQRVAADPDAELGLAFDADGDRLAVVDAQGRWIPPDRVLMVLAADVLSRAPGADIVFDSECGRHTAQYVVQHGGRPLTVPPLPCRVQARLEEAGAALGGSFSGHLWFRERWFGSDDALYGAARLVEVLSADPLTSDEIFAALPRSVATPCLEVPLDSPGEAEAALARLQQAADGVFDDARVDTQFGVRVDFADGWGAVRPAYARAALQFRFEADDDAALARIQDRFRQWLEAAGLGMSPPF